MKNLLLCITTIFASSLLTVCEGQTQLPKEMPAGVRMSFGSNGGMTMYYTSIEITGDTLAYKARTPAGKGREDVWTAKISPTDTSDLYAAFVENKFDQIRNEKNETITYDAGSEEISISVTPNISYNVQSGANFPLSGENKLRYQTVAGRFEKLVRKYESVRDKPVVMSLADARKQAVAFFETIDTDKTGKTMYQAKFTPFFPTNWAGAKQTNWVSYVYASGFEVALVDGERTSKPFAKISFNPATQTATLEKLLSALEAGDIQGVKPLPKEISEVLRTEQPVEKIVLQTKKRDELSAENAVSVRMFYRMWKKYNGVIYQQLAANHSEFNQWIDDQASGTNVKE